MNVEFVKSVIDRVNYSHELDIMYKDKVVLRLKIHEYRDFNEVSFVIYDISKIWFIKQIVRERLALLNKSVIIVECINREYFLRYWLKYIGFKEKVRFPSYYKVNEKYFDYIILEYIVETYYTVSI